MSLQQFDWRCYREFLRQLQRRYNENGQCDLASRVAMVGATYPVVCLLFESIPPETLSSIWPDSTLRSKSGGKAL